MTKDLFISGLSKLITIAVIFILYFSASVYFVTAEENHTEASSYSTVNIVPYNDTSNLKDQKSPGRKISFDLQDVDITDTLKFLAARAGKSITISKNITGKINFLLKNIAIEDAVEIIALSGGLAYTDDGKKIDVMTDEEYNTIYKVPFKDKKSIRIIQLKYASPLRIKQVLSESSFEKIIEDVAAGNVILINKEERLKQMEELIKIFDQPVITEVFNLKYGDISKIEETLEGFITKGFGSVEYDRQAKKITVNELSSKIEKIKKFILEFEENSREVSIGTRIVQVFLDKKHPAGIDLKGLSDIQNIEFSGNFKISDDDILKLYKASQIESVLKQLAGSGKTKSIYDSASTVFNGKELRIFSIEMEKFLSEQDFLNDSTVPLPGKKSETFNMPLELYLTPVIKNDGSVFMKLRAGFNSQGLDLSAPLKTHEGSNVIIKEGEVLVIGGLLKDERVKEKRGIPVLNKIPLIKFLFSWNVERIKKTEILIFVSPEISD